MSETKTIRVNRVVNTTSGQNNQTVKKQTLRRKARCGGQPINVTIHNIFKPVNRTEGGASSKGGASSSRRGARGFTRTGRTVPASRRMQSRGIRPSAATSTSRQLPTSFIANKKTVRGSRKTFRAKRSTLKTNRRAFKTNRKAFKASRRTFKANRKAFRASRRGMVRNRATAPRRMASSPARRVVSVTPTRAGYQTATPRRMTSPSASAGVRPALRFFGRKRR